jgi:hypothetical protein
VVRAVANRLAELIIQGNRANYEIGRLIDQVYLERLWTNWLGTEFSTFNDWSWTILGRKERWARYMRSNFLQIHGMDLAADTTARVMRVGWTKLAQVLRIAKTEHHLLQWIDRIENDNLTEEDIRAEVAIAVGVSTESTDPDDESKDGGVGSSAPSSPSAPGERQTNSRRINYALTFTNDDDLRVFVKAIKIVRQRINPEMSQGEAAALIATSYLGVSAREDEGGLAVELDSLLRCIEQGYRVKLELADEQPEPRQTSAAATAEPEPF